MNKKCIDDCANCTKDNGKDICKIAADDGIVKKIEFEMIDGSEYELAAALHSLTDDKHGS